MIKQELIKEIIEYIPSKTIKNEIYNNNYNLDDLDIIYFIDIYCDIYDKKLKYLNEFCKMIKDEKLLKYCLLLIKFENKNMKTLKRKIVDVFMKQFLLVII